MGNVDLGTFATEQSKADCKFTTNAIKSCMKTIIITCEIFKFKKILIPVSYHVHTPSLYRRKKLYQWLHPYETNIMLDIIPM